MADDKNGNTISGTPNSENFWNFQSDDLTKDI